MQFASRLPGRTLRTVKLVRTLYALDKTRPYRTHSSIAGRKTRETRYSRHSRPGNPTLAFLRSLASRARLAIHLQRDHSPHNIRGKFDYALICQNRCPPYNIRGKFDTPFIRISYIKIYTQTLQLYSSAAAGPIETNKTPPRSSRLGQQLSSISCCLSLKTEAL